jgi:hypothetical protein
MKALQLKRAKIVSNPSTVTMSTVRKYIVGLRWF